MKSNSELLQEHADSRNLTPGERSTLLLAYLCVRQMFPSITLAEFLVASSRAAGATKENRKSPKDAIDHHCPTKGSQWPPAKRMQIMFEYLDFCDSVDMSFDDFLSAVLGGGGAEQPVEQVPESSPKLDADALGQPDEVALEPEPAPVTVPQVPQPVEPTQPAVAAPPVSLLPPGSNVVDVTMTIGDARVQVDRLLSHPLPGAAIGDSMLQFYADCDPYRICVDITNGEPKPFVDVYVRDMRTEQCPVVFELPPSKEVPSTVVLRVRPDFFVNLVVT